MKGAILTTVDKDSIRDVLISLYKIDILSDGGKIILNSYVVMVVAMGGIEVTAN